MPLVNFELSGDRSPLRLGGTQSLLQSDLCRRHHLGDRPEVLAFVLVRIGNRSANPAQTHHYHKQRLLFPHDYTPLRVGWTRDTPSSTPPCPTGGVEEEKQSAPPLQ